MQRKSRIGMNGRLVLCAAALMGWMSLAGAPSVRFDPKTIDVGEISASKGVVSRTFNCMNEGDQPLVILKAETTCGCTKARFSKRPIMPGKASTITVTYDPRNQSGSFLKTIRITTNQSEGTSVVVLKGSVVK